MAKSELEMAGSPQAEAAVAKWPKPPMSLWSLTKLSVRPEPAREAVFARAYS
jgi:hypothetical protein